MSHKTCMRTSDLEKNIKFVEFTIQVRTPVAPSPPLSSLSRPCLCCCHRPSSSSSSSSSAAIYLSHLPHVAPITPLHHLPLASPNEIVRTPPSSPYDPTTLSPFSPHERRPSTTDLAGDGTDLVGAVCIRESPPPP